ncbi:MAG: acetylornithine deacetylase [Actinomycetota bacterium]|jgi:acetylornithine deacetylase|nr:acetylornithine deacetylase [Actinomycetota bacterium]|tara:strand:- start:4774 stop:5946 length:1173 start_codon:yes stop_codon:yes gene_type:complete
MNDQALTKTLDILKELISFETVALTSNLDLITYAEKYLSDLGAKVSLTHSPDGERANLFASFGPEINGGIVLSGHSDVVPVNANDWTTPPFQADQRNDCIFGRGSADMKGFIACVLALAPWFASLDLIKPLHIALTFDEEDGFHGAPILLKDLKEKNIQPDAVIIGEPTGLKAIAAHKGCYEYATTIKGLNGHSSEPEKAVNAVQYAARFINRLMELKMEMVSRAPENSPYQPPSTTMSVGTIEGGQARCIVAEHCKFDWEMRPIQRSDAEYVHEQLAAFTNELLLEMKTIYPEASIETEKVCEVDGLEYHAESSALSLMTELLGESEFDVVSYGTEAGLYQAAGMPAVVWGPGDIEVAHRPDEFVSISDLKDCLSVLERLGLEVLTKTH